MVTGGHENPFAAALIACLPRLRRYAAALSGNIGVADDLVQDCIERALRRADSLKDLSRMAPWLRSILFNVYLDWMRHRRSQGTVVDLMAMDNDLALSTHPSDHAIGVDIVRALNGLSPEHRQVLLLVGLEGLSYREVASELGIPIGTVMSRLARARERLREALEAGGTVYPLPGRKAES